MLKIGTKNAIKAFYYLLAVDGEVDDSEIQKFKELSEQLDKNSNEYIENVIEECQKNIQTEAGEDYCDIVQEALDEAVRSDKEKDEEEILVRLLVWDMLVLAFADNQYSESEKRIIKHIVRTLKMDMSVFMEMEQMIQTASAVEREKKRLEDSDRPYRLIRPLVVELEERLTKIMENVMYLVEDEKEADEPYHAKDEPNAIVNAVANVGNQVGGFAADAVANAGNFLGGLFKSKKKEETKLNVNTEEKRDK